MKPNTKPTPEQKARMLYITETLHDGRVVNLFKIIGATQAQAVVAAAAPSMADAIRALLAEIDADADCPSVGAIQALRDSLAKAEGR